MTDEQLQALVIEAYIAGFVDSAEGFNGEYPFDSDSSRARMDEFVQSKARGYAQMVVAGA